MFVDTPIIVDGTCTAVNRGNKIPIVFSLYKEMDRYKFSCLHSLPICIRMYCMPLPDAPPPNTAKHPQHVEVGMSDGAVLEKASEIRLTMSLPVKGKKKNRQLEYSETCVGKWKVRVREKIWIHYFFLFTIKLCRYIVQLSMTTTEMIIQVMNNERWLSGPINW